MRVRFCDQMKTGHRKDEVEFGEKQTGEILRETGNDTGLGRDESASTSASRLEVRSGSGPSSSGKAEASSDRQSPLSRVQVFGFLAGYFILQFLTRALLSGSFQADEAEQLLLAQEWRWGYGSQGPLYTWLQAVLFIPFGPTAAALALLKNFLLFCVYLFTYLGAREVLRREDHALLAATSLLFIPHLAWESQRDQTHLVLASALAAATIFVFLRLVRTRRLRWYVLFGVTLGAGVMAKYNFTFLLIGLLLAALTFPDGRRAMFDRRSGLALVALIVVTGPHLAWMVQNPDLLMSQSYKFGAAATSASEPGAIRGLMKLLKGTAEYAVTPLIFGLFLWRAPRTGDVDLADRDLARLLLRAIGMAFAVVAFAVVAFGVSNVKSRWLQPLFLSIPILVIYAGRGRLTLPVQRSVFFGAVGVAVVVLTALNSTVLAAHWLRRPHNLNVAFDQLAQQLRDEGVSHGVLISDDTRVAGNLLKEFPQCVALVPMVPYVTFPKGGPALLVWDASRGTQPPPELVGFATRVLGTWPTNQAPQVIQAPGHHGDPRPSQLGFVLLPPEGIQDSDWE